MLSDNDSFSVPAAPFRAADFGSTFHWGVSTAAYQIEGCHQAEGKGPSIWDNFTARKGKIQSSHHGRQACDFYTRSPQDLRLMRSLHIPNFRFSLAWSRIIPAGTGPVNTRGLDFYDRLVDRCLEEDITPWVTLYHWDLPEALQTRGGWTNRDIVGWFGDYAQVCATRLGDRVRHWMVLNEPMVFTGAGYFLGVHAPGRRGLGSFLAAAHHAALCQGEGGRALRSSLPASAEIGTTFSCSYVRPYRPHLGRDLEAAVRVDALLNRLFLEPALGLGYPLTDLPALRRIEKYVRPGDEARLPFAFDFVGLQNYTRELVRHTWYTPFLRARLVPAAKRQVPHTVMGWEVYPEALYQMLLQYSRYPQVKKIIVTENGAAFPDRLALGLVHDPERVAFLQAYLGQVLRARQEGVRVEGYFVWSFTDNFEWAEGFHPRFGLVYVDYATQERIVKSSGHWYRSFLQPQGAGLIL